MIFIEGAALADDTNSECLCIVKWRIEQKDLFRLKLVKELFLGGSFVDLLDIWAFLGPFLAFLGGGLERLAHLSLALA